MAASTSVVSTVSLISASSFASASSVVSSSVMSQKILVTGAGGMEAKAFVHALLGPPSFTNGRLLKNDNYHVYLLCSASEKKGIMNRFKAYGDVSIIEGDLNDDDTLRKIFSDMEDDGGFWGIYAVSPDNDNGLSKDKEEKQVKLLASLAATYAVQCFIYSSGIRAGVEQEPKMKLSQKASFEIEKFCKVLSTHGLPWVFIRSGFFLENFTGPAGYIKAGVLQKGLNPNTTIAVVGVQDVARVAVKVFEDPDKYRNRAMTVVSEFLTIGQISRSYKYVTGEKLGPNLGRLASAYLLGRTKNKTMIKNIQTSYIARASGHYPEVYKEITIAKQAVTMETCEDWLDRKATDMKRKNRNKPVHWKIMTGQFPQF